MATTQYIGARYVPLFADPAEWNSTRTYEALTIVMNEGNSYTSKQYVPKGIDISNEDFWALTGNYNAQVEAYRQDVLRYATQVNAISAALNSEVERAKSAEESNSEAIATEVERAKSAENKLFSDKKLLHFGAIDLINYTTQCIPQGFCIKNETLICVITNSTDNNDCTVFDVNKKTGAIKKTTQVEWHHANSLAYDKKDNVIYVTPCYDYSDSKKRLNYILKVNADDYSTIAKIYFDFNPHSIAIDPVTDNCVITGERDTGIDFYKINKETWETSFMFSLNKEQLNFANNTNMSSQNVRLYNNKIWYLTSGNSNTLLQLNFATGVVENVITGLNTSYIYLLREAECFDFTAEGDIYLWSLSSYYARNNFGVLSMLNVYGNKCVSTYDEQQAGYSLNTYLNSNFNSSICKFGTKDAPFTSIVECLFALKTNNASTILIANDYIAPNITLTCTFPIKIALDNCKLTLKNNLICTYTHITRNSGTCTLEIENDLNIYGYVSLNQLTVVGKTLYIRELLISRIISGGTFNGNYSAAVIKTTSSDGEYTNFISPYSN